MIDAFSLFLARAEACGKVRHFGDQIRMACPVCGGRNVGTLAARRGDTGAVLLRCWKSDCSPEAIAAALGLTITDLFPPKLDAGHGAGPARRRSLLTDREALELARDEVQFVAVAASNVGNGVALNDVDRARCLTAASRLNYLVDEVRA